MDCKNFRELLPELTSGEICGKTVQDAEEHMSACQPCADEFTAYNKAMDALSGPHTVFDAPSRLTMPHLPQARSSRWMYTLPAAAVIVIIGLILILPGMRHSSDVQVAARPDIHASVDASIQSTIQTGRHDARLPKLGHREKRSVIAHESPIPEKVPMQRIAEHQPNNPKYTAGIASADVTDNNGTASIPAPSPGTSKKTGFVIVSMGDTQPASSIKIRSIDHSTGTITSYNAMTDSDGDMKSMLITSSKVAEKNRRETL